MASRDVWFEGHAVCLRWKKAVESMRQDGDLERFTSGLTESSTPSLPEGPTKLEPRIRRMSREPVIGKHARKVPPAGFFLVGVCVSPFSGASRLFGGNSQI